MPNTHCTIRWIDRCLAQPRANVERNVRFNNELCCMCSCPCRGDHGSCKDFGAQYTNIPPAEMLLGLLTGIVWIMCGTQGEYRARQWSPSRIKKTLRRAVWIIGSTTALLLYTTGIQGEINLLRTASPKP